MFFLGVAKPGVKSGCLQIYAEVFFCALLRSFMLFCALLRTCVCTLLRSFALFSHLRVSASNRVQNNCVWELQIFGKKHLSLEGPRFPSESFGDFAEKIHKKHSHCKPHQTGKFLKELQCHFVFGDPTPQDPKLTLSTRAQPNLDLLG